MFETCLEIRNHFSDYVDELCTPEARKSIRYHLSFCEVCREQLEQWEEIHEELRTLPRRQVPPDLALRVRVQMSQLLHRQPILPQLRVRLENVLRPLLIPATGGVLTAVICFCLFMGSPGVPINNTTDDVNLELVRPARVEELAPIDVNSGDNGVVLLTQINADGRAKGYRVLSGQSSPELLQQLDRMIFFSRFRPATMFGKPTDGQVMISLRRITVRG